MLCAFDPVKYCSAAPRCSGGHDPQIRLEAAANQDARLGAAIGQHALDEREPREDVGERQRLRRSRGCRGRRWSRCRGARCRPSRSRRRARVLSGTRRGSPPCRWRAKADDGRRMRCRSSIACRISCSFFSPMPLMARMRPDLRGFGEVVETLDPQLAVENRNRLRPDALKAQHVEQGRPETR